MNLSTKCEVGLAYFVSPGLQQLTILRHPHSGQTAAGSGDLQAESLLSRGCSLSRMRLHAWCRALDGIRPHRQCYGSCTGFQFDVGWISRWPTWSTCHCLAYGSSLSGRRLPVGLRRSSSSAVFYHIEDVRCETNLLQLWRQVFCSCGSEAVE